MKTIKRHLNCPNCGAPIDPEYNKCQYCGTSYFDISGLDLSTDKPFFLKIRIGDKVITQLVKYNNGANINLTTNEVDAYGGIGNQKICNFISSISVETSLNFNAIPFEHKGQSTLMLVEVEV